MDPTQAGTHNEDIAEEIERTRPVQDHFPIGRS